jgi:hypothetical protein
MLLFWLSHFYFVMWVLIMLLVIILCDVYAEWIILNVIMLIGIIMSAIMLNVNQNKCRYIQCCHTQGHVDYLTIRGLVLVSQL